MVSFLVNRYLQLGFHYLCKSFKKCSEHCEEFSWYALWEMKIESCFLQPKNVSMTFYTLKGEVQMLWYGKKAQPQPNLFLPPKHSSFSVPFIASIYSEFLILEGHQSMSNTPASAHDVRTAYKCPTWFLLNSCMSYINTIIKDNQIIVLIFKQEVQNVNSRVTSTVSLTCWRRGHHFLFCDPVVFCSFLFHTCLHCIGICCIMAKSH